ncbi:MAG: phage integrase SAM-like domain-containing protein [Rubripirellula sp.]|nr:phage integrase SAM-like domain-containing protein [Rubripirellula sp.]
MARIVTRSNGLREIRFDDKNGKSRTVFVGRMPKRDAESVGIKIDHLVSRQIMGTEPDPMVSKWVADLPGKLHSKLVKFGLSAERITNIESDIPAMPTIKSFTDQYVADHPGKDGTKEQLEITARSLCKKFGGDTPIDQITAGDAEAYRKWLETKGNERRGYSCGLAKNTVRRRIGRSKQFFRYAVKLKLIPENPFADEISATTGNEDRLVMVPADWIEKIIRQTKCEDWRVILALARYGGLRSHECRIQRWDDIDIPNRKMLIRSNKSPAVRVCPIFPELLPHLMRAREMAESGSEFVQNRYRHDDNILRELVRMIERAKLVPWTKPMQNLRATRETELAASYPLTDVTSWLGNSPTVAGKHYLMTQEDSFQRAANEGATISGITSGVNPNPHQNPHQTVHSGGSQQITPVPETLQIAGDDIEGALTTLAVHLSSYPARTRTLND